MILFKNVEYTLSKIWIKHTYFLNCCYHLWLTYDVRHWLPKIPDCWISDPKILDIEFRTKVENICPAKRESKVLINFGHSKFQTRPCPKSKTSEILLINACITCLNRYVCFCYNMYIRYLRLRFWISFVKKITYVAMSVCLEICNFHSWNNRCSEISFSVQ